MVFPFRRGGKMQLYPMGVTGTATMLDQLGTRQIGDRWGSTEAQIEAREP